MSEFWRIYRLVLARRWMILGLVLIALVTVLIAHRVAQDQMQYLATAVVLPSPKAMSAGGLFDGSQDNGTGVLSQTYDRNSRLSLFTQSIQGHLQDSVNEAALSPREQKLFVVKALSNQLNAAERKKYTSPTVSDTDMDQVLAHFNVPTSQAVWTPRTISKDMLLQLRDGLSAAPIYDNSVTTPGSNGPNPTMTDYLQVQVHAPSPAEAEQLATLTAAAFVNGYQQAGKDEYDNSIAQFRDNQQQAKLALDKAQNALVDFQRRTGLVNLAMQSNAQVQDLQTLMQQRDSAQVQYDAATRLAGTVAQQLSATSPQTVTHLDPEGRPEVQQLQTKVNQDEAALQALAARYTPANPEYKRAAASLQAEKTSLTRLLTQPYIIAHENLQYNQLKAQEDTAQAEAARQQAAINALNTQIAALNASNSTKIPAAEKQLNTLQNTLNTAVNNKNAADLAYSRLVSANKELDNGLITLTNPATFATPDTSGPSLAALLIYATLLSLVIGVALTIGLDALDNRVQTIADAEKLLGMSISAVIPAMPPGDPRRLTRMIVTDPLSPVAEAYRLLRTDLLFTAEDRPFKSLMGATAKPGQGATTTICNLAVALAQVGKRVILIDADLRRPKLHDYFNVSNETGLTSLLRNECEMEEALKLTDIDNLLILPSGPLPLNPSELLASPRMRTLHERMKPHTDFILVDTPSAIAFSDSAIMASFMDAVLLVVRAQEAPRGGEARVREMLTKARANVVGVVLNGVQPQLVDSYHYHAAYYPQLTTSTVPADGSHVLSGPSIEPPLVAPAAAVNGYTNGHGGNGHTPEPSLAEVHFTAGPGNPITDTQPGTQPLPSADEIEAANPEREIESTTVMAAPADAAPEAKSRFNWRSMFGTDDQK